VRKKPRRAKLQLTNELSTQTPGRLQIRGINGWNPLIRASAETETVETLPPFTRDIPMALIVFVYCTCAANLNFFSNTGGFFPQPSYGRKSITAA